MEMSGKLQAPASLLPERKPQATALVRFGPNIEERNEYEVRSETGITRTRV
jgi:hypothetical protein